MLLAEELKVNSQKKIVKVVGKVEESSKKKLDVVCGHFSISVETYVGTLIERSELDKAYKAVLKEQKENEKCLDMDENSIKNEL